MAAPRATVFCDTSFFVALIDLRDGLHDLALTLANALDDRRAQLVTTDAVLIELGNYFARSPLRAEAARWVMALRVDANWRISPIESSLLARAERRYAAYGDKSWSMTDCISMEAMNSLRIREVATSDRGFLQAGFDALLG